MRCKLLRVMIRHDRNENNEMAYLVTPVYLLDGKTMTVPDTKGWPTRGEAELDAQRIQSRKAR